MQTPIYVYNRQFFLSQHKAFVFRDTFLCPESRVTNSRILSTAYVLQTLITCALSFLVVLVGLIPSSNTISMG